MVSQGLSRPKLLTTRALTTVHLHTSAPITRPQSMPESHKRTTMPVIVPAPILLAQQRARGRRVPLRVRSDLDDLAVPTRVHRPRAAKVPLLKVSKRSRPQWQPPVDHAPNPVKARTEPRATSGPDFGPMMQAQGKKLMSPSACMNVHPFADTLRE